MQSAVPWLTDSFILTMTRKAKQWSICLHCHDCGTTLPLQSGELHQLHLRENLERQIIASETLHKRTCPANSVPSANGNHAVSHGT